MDEEIMNFQWFDHVTWDSIKDLRGTTYVQPPTGFKFALQRAQQAILRVIIHSIGIRASLESTRAQQLASLGTTCKHVREQLCTHFGCAIGALLGGGLVSTLDHGTC